MNLTLDSFKKAAKRHAAQTGKPLSTAQEKMAVLLGFPSFHAVTQRLGPPASSKKTIKHVLIGIYVLGVALLFLPSLFNTASDTLWGNPPSSTRPSPSRAFASTEAVPAFANIKHTVSLEINTPAALTGATRSMINACQAPCKLISQKTSINSIWEESAATFWIPLQAKDGFIRSMESLGTLRASKTDWLDVSGELARATSQRDNLRASRDQLRETLTQPGAQESTLRIQEELKKTQALLDTAATTRNELDMQATTLIVDVQLTRAMPEPDKLEKLIKAAKRNFMSGVDLLVDTLPFCLPLLVAGGLCWLAFNQVEVLIKRRKLATEGKTSGALAKPGPKSGPGSADSSSGPGRASPDDDGSNSPP